MTITVSTLRAAGLSDEEIGRVFVAAYSRKNQERRLHEKDLSGPCFIYVLFNPERRRAFYVGISKYQFHRFEQHRTDPGSAAYGEVNELLRCGWPPRSIYRVYRKCSNRREALKLEHKLINAIPGLLNRERREYTHWGAV